MTFTWTLPDPLNGTAETLSIYITEIQDAINVQRAIIGQAPIVFIDQTIGELFRYNAIIQMKTVIDELVDDYGYTLGVEDPSLLGRPWIIMSKRFGKYLASYPIINDMRLILKNLITMLPKLVIINWTEGDGVTYNENNLINTEITSGPIEIQYQRDHHQTYSGSYMTVDDDFVYTGYYNAGGGLNLRKYTIGSISPVYWIIIGSGWFNATDFEVDDTHFWVVHVDTNDISTPNENKHYISNITKEPVFALDQQKIVTLPQEYKLTFGSPNYTLPLYYWNSLTCDANNIYVSGFSRASTINTSGGTIEERHILYKVGKDGSSPLMVSVDEHLTDPLEIPPPSSWTIRISRETGFGGAKIASQGNGFYMNYWEEVNVDEINPGTGYHHSQRKHLASAILKINPDLTVAAVLDNDRVWALTRDNGVNLYTTLVRSYRYAITSIGHGGSGLATSNNYVYSIGCREGTQIIMDGVPTRYDLEYRILNHSGVLQYRAYNINGQLINLIGLGIDTVESYLTRFV